MSTTMKKTTNTCECDRVCECDEALFSELGGAKAILDAGGALRLMLEDDPSSAYYFSYTYFTRPNDMITITYDSFDVFGDCYQYGFEWNATGCTLESTWTLITKPTDTITITQNGTNIDVLNYAKATVNVQPSLQSKTATPAVSAQTITADSGYYGLSSVAVGAIPYVETQNTYGITVTIG